MTGAAQRKQRMESSLCRLSDLMPSGHLLATMDPAGFLNTVSDEIERLRKCSAQRASEADLLNTELRENYGGQFQVLPEDDWRPAIRALVDGVRHGEAYKRTKEEAQ